MAVDLTKNGRTKIHLVVIRIPWDQEFEFSFLLYYSFIYHLSSFYTCTPDVHVYMVWEGAKLVLW